MSFICLEVHLDFITNEIFIKFEKHPHFLKQVECQFYKLAGCFSVGLYLSHAVDCFFLYFVRDNPLKGFITYRILFKR